MAQSVAHSGRSLRKDQNGDKRFNNKKIDMKGKKSNHSTMMRRPNLPVSIFGTQSIYI